LFAGFVKECYRQTYSSASLMTAQGGHIGTGPAQHFLSGFSMAALLHHQHGWQTRRQLKNRIYYGRSLRGQTIYGQFLDE
jgi:hypothetical protein